MSHLSGQIGSSGVAILAPVDKRQDSKQMGFFDPNTADTLKQFKTEQPLEVELGNDFKLLLAAYGIHENPEAPVALRLVLRDCTLTGNRRFGATAFSVVIALDVEVFSEDREQPLFVVSTGAVAKSTGTSGGSQKRYYDAAFTNAVAEAMRALSASRDFAEGVIGASRTRARADAAQE